MVTHGDTKCIWVSYLKKLLISVIVVHISENELKKII